MGGSGVGLNSVEETSMLNVVVVNPSFDDPKKEYFG